MLDDDVTLESERGESAALTRSREKVVAKLQAGYSGYSDVSALTPYERPKGANPPPPSLNSHATVCVLSAVSLPLVAVSDTGHLRPCRL